MRHKLILLSGYIYREVELSEETQRVRIGTASDADVRFKASDFFNTFCFDLFQQSGSWKIECGDGVYVKNSSSSQKLLVYSLKENDEITINYFNTDANLFKVIFSLDFDYEEKKYNREIDLENILPLKIGAEKNNHIRFSSEITMGDNITIEKNDQDYILQCTSRGIGTLVNGRRVDFPIKLNNHDFFSTGSYFFYIADGKLFTDSDNGLIYDNVGFLDKDESRSHHIYPKFNRSSRVKKVLSEEKITILDPPRKPEKPKGNIITQLFPAIGMLAVTILIRGVLNSSGGTFVLMSVCSIGIGLLTSIMNIIVSKRDFRRDIKKREDEYNRYIQEKSDFIEKIRDEERNTLNEIYISPKNQLKRIEDFSEKLFERIPMDEDFLEIRLGSGEKEALRKVEYKIKDQVELLDDLAKKPKQMAGKFKKINGVPITINVNMVGRIGVVGCRKDLYNMLKIMTLDLITHQYYTDEKFIYFIDEKDRKLFEWIKLLPQVQNEELDRRNIVCDEESKSIVMDYLYKTISIRDKKICLPHIIVFVFRERGIQNHPLSEMIHREEAKGVTFVYFQEYEDYLPQECEYIIKLSEDGNGEVINCDDVSKTQHFIVDNISNEEISHAVRKLAPVYCEEISLESALTKKISFFEMLDIYEPEDINIAANWENSRVYESMAAPLGVKAKDQIVYLDLHEKQHGPHGLVAGTTGSGKSEILQSYILSMALNYHPYEVGFVIIDFKGGGMVNQFKNLPHLIGAITNIDGKEIDRSLLSIRAELKKRQELFAKYGVNHIDAYIKLYKAGKADIALPHLILIVDEFAELKVDQPEFMKELISTSRIGRSLGVHLILATQKPSGVVDPQIWSNSRFKLCLKVQSREDSNEVLKSPMAAKIIEPGRAYLQVGNNEIFELFQSAYSGGSVMDTGDDVHAFDVSRVSLEGKRTLVYRYNSKNDIEKEETQLESIVRYVADYCSKEGISRLPYIFLPPLAERLSFQYHERNLEQEEFVAWLGMYDNPSEQYQGDMSINVTLGNTFIIGSAQNGKTNLLQTILRSLTEQYSPEEVNIYILDFGSMIFKNYEDLNHVGGVVCAADDEKCKNLFKLLEIELKKRKEILVSKGVSSFASYIEAGFTDLPQIIVMIDNLTAMRDMYLMENDFLLPLCRDGIAVGITFIIANGQTSGIGFRYLSNFEQRIALYCNENSEYSMLLDNCRMRPKNIPGRCLFSRDKEIYEGQTYLAFDGEKEIERVAHILEFVKEQNQYYAGKYAIGIPEVPKKLSESIMEKKFHCRTSTRKLIFGIDYGTVTPVTQIWGEWKFLAISGRDALGKSIFVEYLLRTLNQIGAEIFISDDIVGSLDSWKDKAVFYSRSTKDTADIIAEIEMSLREEYSLMIEGTYDPESRPVYIWFVQNRGVIQEIVNDKECLSRFKRVVNEYNGLKFMIIYSDLENASIGFQSPEPLKMLKDNRNYIVFDNLESIKLFDVPGTVARKYKKPLEIGDAYMLRENTLIKLKVIQ